MSQLFNPIDLSVSFISKTQQSKNPDANQPTNKQSQKIKEPKLPIKQSQLYKAKKKNYQQQKKQSKNHHCISERPIIRTQNMGNQTRQRVKLYLENSLKISLDNYFSPRIAVDYLSKDTKIINYKIHLYGVDMLSTKAINKYFSYFNPICVSMINAASANVEFQSQVIARKALFANMRYNFKYNIKQPQKNAQYDPFIPQNPLSYFQEYELVPYSVLGIQRKIYGRFATNKDLRQKNDQDIDKMYRKFIEAKKKLEYGIIPTIKYYKKWSNNGYQTNFNNGQNNINNYKTNFNGYNYQMTRNDNRYYDHQIKYQENNIKDGGDVNRCNKRRIQERDNSAELNILLRKLIKKLD